MRARTRGVALLVALCLTGCGWHAGVPTTLDLDAAGTTEASGEPRVALDLGAGATVGVAFFDIERKVLERDLEPLLQAELSSAVVDLVEAPLASVNDARWIVEGRIHEYRRRSGIRGPDHILLESGVRIIVSAQLVDRTSGDVRSRARASIWSSYSVEGPDSEEAARDRALFNISRTLVLDLFRPRSTGSANSAAPEE